MNGALTVLVGSIFRGTPDGSGLTYNAFIFNRLAEDASLAGRNCRLSHGKAEVASLRTHSWSA